jgi:hypothetical protein
LAALTIASTFNVVMSARMTSIRCMRSSVYHSIAEPSTSAVMSQC